jgi:hypothetical protein
MYPLESLRARLVFEREKTSNIDHTSEPIQLTPAVANALKVQDESDPRYYSRSGALRELHENSYREFARAAGFGFMRMDSLRYRLSQSDEKITFRMPAVIAISDPTDVNKSLRGSHAEAIDDFISPDRMGYVRSRDKVAGFESHRFRTLDRRWNSPFQDGDNSERWQVARLELVGLLRHPEPCVYTAKQFPAMDQLDDVPHRALSDFEKAALGALRTQQDVVINQQTNRILMLGAVRASTTCLECHEAPRGKLLGAFSYELVRITGNKTSESGGEQPVNL